MVTAWSHGHSDLEDDVPAWLLWGPPLCILSLGIAFLLLLFLLPSWQNLLQVQPQPSTLVKSAAGVLGYVCLGIGCNFWRTKWLSAIGVEREDVAATLGTGQLDLCRILQAVDEYHVRMCDGMTRKIWHIQINIIKMVVWSKLLSLAEIMPCTLACYLAILCLDCVLLRSDSFLAIYGLFVVRLRDGKWRRWNIIFVNVSTVVGTFCTTMIWTFLIQQSRAAQKDPALGKAVLTLIWIPLGIGDAAAEIFGVLFGKHEFEVTGLGEINRKTLEGCAGMFSCTWLPSAFVVYSFNALNTTETHIFVIMVALVTTALETWTPRGFDNFTITGAAILMWTLHLRASHVL